MNLSQGFPNFLPPAELLELVERALRGRYHQYALMPGSMALRTAIAEKLARVVFGEGRPRRRDHRHERRHGGDLRRDSGRRAPRRRGHRVRPVLRLLRALDHAGRRPHRPPAADAARLRDRLGAAAGGAERSHAPRHRELAAQSERRAARAARTSTGSRSCCARTIAICSATRSTSTSSSTARGTRRRSRSRSSRSAALPCFRSARPITRRGGSSATASRRRRCRRSCGACIST